MKGDSVSAYVHVRRDTPPPLPLYAALRILDDPPSQSPQQLRTHLIDDPFLNQKTYKYIRISHLLKYKHSKK